MNLCMFPRRHFSHFVSDQKPVSKRGQDQNIGEGSATAKPKPMSLVQGQEVWCVKCLTGSSSTTALSNPENLGKALTKMSDVDSSSGNRLSITVTQVTVSSILK